MAALETDWTMSASGSSGILAEGVNNTNADSKNSNPSSATSTSGSSKPVTASPTYATFSPAPNALPHNTSPLLSSTPPTVTKALSQAYPLILAADHILGLLTWTSDDIWKSFLLAACWTSIVLYFEILVKYFGHLLAVGTIAGYVWLNNQVVKDQAEHPTLDAIVHTLNNCVTRLNLFVLPVSNLKLTNHDVVRLLFTTLFLSPVYMIIANFILSPRSLLLIGGLVVLTYHSVWARVTRAILWRSRSVRLLSFYLTGLDFSGGRRGSVSGSGSGSELAAATAGSVRSRDGKPVRFTYVVFENQRKWLGIGWTSNLLAYERSPWSDEFLNECNSPETFVLPVADGTGMTWRWVDKTWKLDLTNDGALVLNGGKSRSTADPGPNDGWIYYENTWKKPSTDDSYSKYTRRRRWIRTAELVDVGQLEKEETAVLPLTQDEQDNSNSPNSTLINSPDSSATDSQTSRQRKSIRFQEDS